MTDVPQTSEAPVRGSIWTAFNGEQLRSRGMNGEVLHYDMRRTSEGDWVPQFALPLRYFTSWRDRNQVQQTGVEDV